MEINFTPEQEAELSRIASTTGTDAERLVREAALRILEEDGASFDQLGHCKLLHYTIEGLGHLSSNLV